MEVIVVEVPELGNHAHLVHDGAHALVVDPPRDWRPLELAAEEAGVRIAAVADTHVHNDYVSGAPALARRHGADYWLSADERVHVDRLGVRGGDILGVGDLVVQVLSTPGHTLHHQSFLVTDPESGARTVFSGGSLLHGTVGRTDLVDPLLSRMMGRAQWESARQLGALDDRVGLHPTHGFGSLCAATVPGDGVHGTIGDERGTNPVLRTPRDTYVEALVAGFGPVPRYYRHMSALNRAGAGATPVLPPTEVDEVAVHAAVRAGLLGARPPLATRLRPRPPHRLGQHRGLPAARDVRRVAGAVGHRRRPGQRLPRRPRRRGARPRADRDDGAGHAPPRSGRQLARQHRLPRRRLGDVLAQPARQRHPRRAPRRGVPRLAPARLDAHPPARPRRCDRPPPRGPGVGALPERLPCRHRGQPARPPRSRRRARDRRLGAIESIGLPTVASRPAA